jgi:hypothetical protein
LSFSPRLANFLLLRYHKCTIPTLERCYLALLFLTKWATELTTHRFPLVTSMPCVHHAWRSLPSPHSPRSPHLPFTEYTRLCVHQTLSSLPSPRSQHFAFTTLPVFTTYRCSARSLRSDVHRIQMCTTFSIHHVHHAQHSQHSSCSAQCRRVTGAKPENAPERTGIFRFRCVFAFRQNRSVLVQGRLPRLPVPLRARLWLAGTVPVGISRIFSVCDDDNS